MTINSISKQKIKAIQEGDEKSCIIICEDIGSGVPIGKIVLPYDALYRSDQAGGASHVIEEVFDEIARRRFSFGTSDPNCPQTSGRIFVKMGGQDVLKFSWIFHNNLGDPFNERIIKRRDDCNSSRIDCLIDIVDSITEGPLSC